MRCPNCKRDMQRDRGTHHYTESGLKNVYLCDWEMYTCECGTKVPLLPSAKMLAQLITWAIILAPEPLDADAILFLRKTMGLTAFALAEELGVSRVEVSRWENGHNPLSHSNDFRLRMTAVRKIVPEHLQASTKAEITELSLRRDKARERATEPVLNILPEMAEQFAFA